MTRVKQIKPNHPNDSRHYDDKKLNKLFANEYCISQIKYNGERMLIHFDGDDVYCTSRGFSKKTDRYMENQDKVPKLRQLWKDSKLTKDIGYTVLDCEVYSGKNGGVWSDVASVMGSLADRAIELQKDVKLKFAVWDCIYFDGDDLTTITYDERLIICEEFVDVLQMTSNIDFLHMSEIANENKLAPISHRYLREFRIRDTEHAKQIMSYTLSLKYEGNVVKSLEREYYDKICAIKFKREEYYDVVVYDFNIGRGKYSDTIGSLKVGYYDEDSDTIIHVTNVNCGTDVERREWYSTWPKIKHTVMEVACQQTSKTSLTNPRYKRLRPDKYYKDCTKESIFG